MRLTVTPHEQNPKKIVLTFQDTFFRQIDRFLFQKEVMEKDFSSLEELEEWFSRLEAKIAKKVAIRYLSLRSYPKASLSKKLQVKGFSQETISSLLEYLEKEGFIEEVHSIEKEVEKWARKGFGPLLIFYKLQSKGFDKEMVQKAMSSLLSEEVQMEAIRHLLLKKKGLEKKKMQAFLQRRGYAPSLIQKMIF